MVHVVQRPETDASIRVRFTRECWIAAAGAAVSLLGVWLGVTSQEGTITVLGFELRTAELPPAWYQSLVVAGLAVIGAAFALAGGKLHRRDGWWSPPAIWARVMAGVSAGAALVFVLAWVV